jgi:hypothetical protein
MSDSQTLVTIPALIAGSLCLLIYVVEIFLAEKIKATATAAAATTAPANKTFGAIGPASVSMPDFTNLIEAMAKLTDSLGKVGPSLTSLVGAVLFYAIAAIGSGALQSPPAPARTTASVPKDVDSADHNSGGNSADQANDTARAKP